LTGKISPAIKIDLNILIGRMIPTYGLPVYDDFNYIGSSDEWAASSSF
jgi:hypothetical protein